MATKYPFKNLVLQGGGVKAFAYHGVMAVLEEKGILPQIERVGGASAGAQLATLLSFRLPWQETLRLFRTCDFTQIPAAPVSPNPNWTPRIVENNLMRLKGGVSSVNRLVRKYGWYSSEYAHQWMMGVIAGQCDGNGRATFADFRARGFLDLHIVATNLSERKVVDFSADTTPNVAVADAALMSSLIPLYFEALQFDGQNFGAGDYFADGGVMENYPLHLFDQPKYQEGNSWFFTGINWETIGCRLETPPDCPNTKRTIHNVRDYIEAIFDATLEAQTTAYQTGQADQQRTINVCNCCVNATDFFVKAEENDPTYRRLVAAGREAALKYLADYRPPIDPRLALVLRPKLVVERIKEVFERPLK